MLASMCLKNAAKMWLFGLKKSPKFVNFTIICIIWLLKNEKRGKIIKTNIMRPFTCKRTEKKNYLNNVLKQWIFLISLFRRHLSKA